MESLKRKNRARRAVKKGGPRGVVEGGTEIAASMSP